MATKRVDLKPFQQARTFMVLDNPWWGSLALRLEDMPLEEDPMIPYAATDGVKLYYNPKFFESLTPGRRKTVIAHEVYHCANSHMTRRSSRDAEMWNAACDHVCNLELEANGFEPMKGFKYDGHDFEWLADKRFVNMSAEQVYAILEKEKLQGDSDGGCNHGRPQPGKGGKGGKPCPQCAGKVWNIGAVKDAPRATEEQPLSPQQLEEDWKVAVQEATEVARKAGHLPAGIARMVTNLKKPQYDWREVLRRWISVIGDYSWMRPNRRFLHMGLILPGSMKTQLQSLVFAIDTSGSIDGEMLDLAAAELESIFLTESRPALMHAMYCDAAVQSVDEIEGELKFEPRGGGGTAFQPVFDKVDELCLTPDCVIYFTDTEASDLSRLVDPGYPVLWLIPEAYADRTMPFGETCVLSKY